MHGTAATPFWQRRAVTMAMRCLAVLIGAVGAGVALFVSTLYAVFSVCDADSTGLCTHFAPAVPALEIVLVLLAGVAPLAGGIATCVRRDWGYLAAGLTTGFVMVLLTIAGTTGQGLALS